MEPIGKRIVMPNMTLSPSVSALPGVSATMLVTLAAKALAATDAPETRYRDRRSHEILRELEVDPRSFNLNPSEAVRHFHTTLEPIETPTV